MKITGWKRLPGTMLKRSSFSRNQLVIFAVLFAIVGGIVIIRTFAAGNTKVWDTQADFQSGTLSNTVATSDGHVTLTPTVSGGSGTAPNVPLPTHEIHVEPYNYDPTGSVSAGQGFYWNSYSSPSTARWVTSGNYRTLRVNGQGNSYMGSTSDYQDDWWIAWQDYFPSSFNDPTSAGYMKNFHNTPGDIGWDAASGVSGVSSVALRFDPGTNWYQLDLLDGYSADQHDFNLYQPTRNTWHSVLMHIIFGRAESGVTPKKGRVQVWVDGNNTPVLDTNNSFPNGISTIARPSYGTYANQLQQKVTMFEGGPYNLHFQGSAPAIHDTTAMQFGSTLAAALSDTPTTVSGWGGVQIPGSPTVEAGHPDSYELTVASRNANQFQVPSSLGGTTSTTYPSSGTITLPFDCGTTCSWDSVTPVQTTPSGTSISYQYRSSTDNTTWSAYTSTLSSIPQGRYFQVKATLSTTNSSATPDIDKITLGYTPQNGGGSIGAVTISQSVTNNQTIKGTFTWTATTSDDSQVKIVSFYVDNNLRNTETSAPWGSGDAPNTDAGQVDSTQYADGAHTLKAVATLTDNTTVSTSASVTIQNGTASSPAAFVSSSVTNGQTLSGTVAWNVTTSGSVASVEYWADGAKLNIDAVSPYSYVLDTTKMSNGQHQINVVVVGTDGTRVSAGTGGILGTVTVNNTAVAKTGDLNGDGKVDVVDLSMLLSNFGTNNAAGDVNKDGTVNVLDLSALLTNFSP